LTAIPLNTLGIYSNNAVEGTSGERQRGREIERERERERAYSIHAVRNVIEAYRDSNHDQLSVLATDVRNIAQTAH